jgi:hypothetical protein
MDIDDHYDDDDDDDADRVGEDDEDGADQLNHQNEHEPEAMMMDDDDANADDADGDDNDDDDEDAFHHHHHDRQRPGGDARQSRRRSSTGAGSTTSVSSLVGNGHMTEGEQEERRRQIRTIMLSRDLSQQEKSRSIQSLMDGRQRRCSINSTGGHSYVSVGTTQSTAHSYVSNMSRVAVAASEYYNSFNNVNHSSTDTLGTATGDSTAAAAAAAAGVADPQQQRQQQQQQQQQLHQQQPILDMHQYRDDRSVASSVSSGSAGYNNSDDDVSTTGGPRGGGGGGGSAKMPRPPPPSHIPYRQYHGRSQSLQDWTDTDRLTAAPNTTVLTNPAGVSRLMEQSRPECPHYVRNCTVVAACCGLAFGCRICHDDCPVLPPPILLFQHRRGSLNSTSATPAPHHASKVVERRRSMPVDLQLENFEHEETHHLIDRFAIKEVICRMCYLRQSSKTCVFYCSSIVSIHCHYACFSNFGLASDFRAGV